MPSMSRKRIVAALLLVVTLSLGATAYFVTRTKASEVALSTPEAPLDISEIQPADEIALSTREELLKLAALTGSNRATTHTNEEPAAATPIDEAAEGSDEETTVAMESVDMPATSIVMGSSTDSGESQAESASVVRLARISMGGGASARSGGNGGLPSGNTPPGSPPPSGAGPSPADSQNPGDSTPPPNEGLQNTGEGEGTTQDPEIIETHPEIPPEPPYEGPPVEPPYQFEPPPPGEQPPVSVPEPGTLILLGAGLAALGYGRRRLKQQQ
jgi:hypothetical protein